MTLRFTVLASGSAGNASLIQTPDFNLLLDIGLGPRILTARLAPLGVALKDIQAVLLTHVHSDHWHERTLAHLLRHNIPLICHPEHHDALEDYSEIFPSLLEASLVQAYQARQEIRLGQALRIIPLPISHDSGATFGFRMESSGILEEDRRSLAYLADLGTWDRALVEAIKDVDLLALEFNHDVDAERESGRSPSLIQRVLGDKGHLSNVQAGNFLMEVVRRSVPGCLKHLVPLHLSRDCNDPMLAEETARAALGPRFGEVSVLAARQDENSPTYQVGKVQHVPGAKPETKPRAIASHRVAPRRKSVPAQAWLPGLEAL